MIPLSRLLRLTLAFALVAGFSSLPASSVSAEDWDIDSSTITPIGNLESYAGALAVQADGKIIVAGYTTVSGVQRDYAIVRYLSDGTLDPTFDGDGILVPNFDADWRSVSNVAIDSAGRIVVTGPVIRNNSYDIGVARFTASGQRDATFNSSGTVPGYLRVDFAGEDDSVSGLVLQGDGKLVLVGQSYVPVNASGDYDMFVIRLNSDGSFDTNFATGGVFKPRIAGVDHDLRDVAIDSAGRIVATGFVATNLGYDPLAIRLTPTGAFDNSFGNSGSAIVSQSPDWTISSKILVRPNGRLVLIASTVLFPPRQMVAIGLDSNGALDPGFGTNGITQTTFSFNDHQANSAALMVDGRIVVAGNVQQTGSSYGFALTRLRADGTVDTSFAQDGLKIQQLGPLEDLLHDVAILPDGRIVAAGASNQGGGYRFALVLFRPQPTIVPVWRSTLDPSGGTCADGSPRTSSWTSAFVGYRYLPGSADCVRSGHVFAGWANATTPDTVRDLPLLVDPATDTKRYFVAENVDLVAVWKPLPTSVGELTVFANFFCRQCTNAWIIHASSEHATSYDYTINTTPVTCAPSVTVFGLQACQITGLPSGTPLAATVTPRNSDGVGPSATARLTLRG